MGDRSGAEACGNWCPPRTVQRRLVKAVQLVHIHAFNVQKVLAGIHVANSSSVVQVFALACKLWHRLCSFHVGVVRESPRRFGLGSVADQCFGTGNRGASADDKITRALIQQSELRHATPLKVGRGFTLPRRLTALA